MEFQSVGHERVRCFYASLSVEVRVRNEYTVQIRNALILSLALVGCSANRSPDAPSQGTIIASANAPHDAGVGGSAGQNAGPDAGTRTNTGEGQPGLGSGGSGSLGGTGGQPAVDAGMLGSGGTGNLSSPDAGNASTDPPADDDDVGPGDAAVTDAAVDAGLIGDDDGEEDDL
jgi:hypothetical protein